MISNSIGQQCAAHANDNEQFSTDGLIVSRVEKGTFDWILLNHHYAKRIPSVSFAFGLFNRGKLVGVCTFGNPASRHMQISACPKNPSAVIELNRLCVLDCQPRNTESWFLSKCLKMLPALIVVSYADSVEGHFGFVYRAANFNYAGWTDMDRKTPRLDYIVPGKHSRDAFRCGIGLEAEKVRRKPKAKYWTVTGDRRQRAALQQLCMWGSICWKLFPPPQDHKQLIICNDNQQVTFSPAEALPR